MTNDTVVPTKELERQWRIATRPAPDDVTEEMAREVFEACDYLAEMSEALAAEVLAGRERDIATREALARISKGSRNAALPSVVALLAAMEVPDDE